MTNSTRPLILPGSIALLLASLAGAAYAEPVLHGFRSLSVEAAAKAAREAMLDCRKRGYSVAVAVVDRGGNTQALLRDRYAGPHTIETAIRKAWTANSFRQSTSDLAGMLQEGRIRIRFSTIPGRCSSAAGSSSKPKAKSSAASASRARRPESRSATVLMGRVRWPGSRRFGMTWNWQIRYSLGW